ncbi:hypothetical protein [Flavobacterium alkalisoli]|uniref:hypothetical protein n=1 Tax=Flavobacterium alkalisoli TaxID=2602769 RepID=UPI003A8F0962
MLNDIPDGESVAEISYIGYKAKLLDLKTVNDTVFLQPDVTQLSELVLEKQVIYTHSQKLKSAKVDEYLGFQFGTEHCVYIENETLKEGRVSGITLYLSKLKDFSGIEKALGKDDYCEGCKMDYLASFKISFYEYDNANNKPGKLLYDNTIISNPENKTYRFLIDMQAFNIPFPENGICVGVELVNTRYKKPKTTFAFIGPRLGFYEYTVKRKARSWVRYRNEGFEFKDGMRYQAKGIIAKALAVDLEVKL